MEYVPSLFYTFVGYKQINTDSIESCESVFNKIHEIQKHFKASYYYNPMEYVYVPPKLSPEYKQLQHSIKENKFYFTKICKYVKKYFNKYSKYISFDSNKVEYDIFVDVLMYIIRYYENNTIIEIPTDTYINCKCSHNMISEYFNNLPNYRYDRMIKHIECEGENIFKNCMNRYMYGMF